MEDYLAVQLRAEGFESENNHYVDGQHKALAYFFAEVDKANKILDCACGDGVGLKWFRDNEYFDFWGFEANPNKVARALEITSHVVQGDMHDMNNYPDASFDYVWSSHSVEHAYKPLVVLKEFNRVLKPTGHLYMVLPYKDVGPGDVHCGQFDLCTNQDTPDNFLKAVDGCGFNILEWKLDRYREPEIWIKASKK